MTRPLESSSKLHRFLTPCLGHSRTNALSENQPFPCMQRTKNKRLTANDAIEQGERPKTAASMDRKTKHHRVVVDTLRAFFDTSRFAPLRRLPAAARETVNPQCLRRGLAALE